MITRTGISTLASGGGIVAAVVCLLVGLQLLLLGSEIHSLLEFYSGSMDIPATAWKNLIQVSGWLSIVASGLVLFLVISERLGWSRSKSGEYRVKLGNGEEIEDLSVRIFEVDASNRMIEITEPDEDPTNRHGPVARPVLSKAVNDTAEDDSASILEEIEALTRPPGTPAKNSWKLFLRRFLGR
jgi:hypothetical protein